jgi:hypothetical protein
MQLGLEALGALEKAHSVLKSAHMEMKYLLLGYFTLRYTV